MFGTDDVIYVPEGQPLVFDDVYGWKRYKIYVGRFGLHVRPVAFDEISGRMRNGLDIARKSPRFAETIDQISVNTQDIIRALSHQSGAGHSPLPGRLDDVVKADRAAWWLHISDIPAESFSPDDYERALVSAGDTTPYSVYGTVRIAQLDWLEVAITGDSDLAERRKQLEAGLDTGDPMPFTIDVPTGGLERFTMPPGEPLALVREFCGVHGNSAFGHTVNVTTLGEVAESHEFCTPFGRIGEKLFVTLYFHINVPVAAKVMGRIPKDRVFVYTELMERSGFVLDKEGPTFRIYQREGGDVVHVYSQLPGKETEGVVSMDPILLVACASGQYDPMQRGELFEAILRAVKHM